MYENLNKYYKKLIRI